MTAYRADCRFRGGSDSGDVKFCLGSLVYRLDRKSLWALTMGVGCDYNTIFSGPAELQTQQVSDRIAPKSASVPALEVPTDSLRVPGTYQATLDILQGRLLGTCYVKQVSYADLLAN